jgi:subtilisin-like proprotein convertase family protein
MRSKTKWAVALVTIAALVIVSVADGADARRRRRRRGGGGGGTPVAPAPTPPGTQIIVQGGGFAIPDNGFQAGNSRANAQTTTLKVTDANLELQGLTHQQFGDLDITLYHRPSATRALVVSDAGNGASASNAAVALDDAAARSLPEFGGATARSFKPTNYGDDDFGPGTTSPTALSTFNAIDPSGEWSVTIQDDTKANSPGAALTGWKLTLTVR